MKPIKALFFAILLSFTGDSIANNGDILDLSPSQQVSSEGYFNLRWNNMLSNENIILQLSSDRQFSRITKSYPLSIASQTANTNQIALSGFKDGRYYFRLANDQNSQLSNIATVDVEHRPIDDAIRLFLLGGILFLILLSALYFSGRFEQQSKQR